MRKVLIVAASALLLASGSVFANGSHGAHATAASAVASKVPATQAALRDLWVGHIFWVREVVRELADKDAAAVKVAEGKVVANARQIADAIEPFYGKAAADQLFELLAGHYTAVKTHAQATFAGDAAKSKQAFNELVANAGKISDFLSKANPYLPRQALNSLLVAHGGHHVQQNEQIAKHDAAGEARTWEEMKSHIYEISDALVGALAKQFPEKF
jgi:hypothetical protein